jgi:hypothetical protein
LSCRWRWPAAAAWCPGSVHDSGRHRPSHRWP